MNHLGGLVVYGGEVGGFWDTCLDEDVYSGCHSGLPLRIKEITMSSDRLTFVEYHVDDVCFCPENDDGSVARTPSHA
jgi:hypothetical protein